jgi:vitamin B12 transporter
MTAKKLFLFLILLLCQMAFAQNDSIVALKEVVVSDTQLKNFSRTQSVTVLNDSILQKNNASLTSLLQYNSTIYFKENGLGMVSSPSFRGTTAQQTAVIWNGININSQLNGQTDFNTITTRDFDNVTVRAGGGSAIYGSSAIGGSIHLNNILQFKKQFSNELQTSYGSFNTFGANYKMRASNDKVSSEVGISRNSSENDYEYLDTKNKHNENGQFYNTSVNADFGYKLNDKHFLKLYSQVFEGERHFSGTISSVSKSKYQDLNSRNLLEWDAFLNKWTSKVKVAFLSEKYKYFENAKSVNFETSKAETFISKYDLNYDLNSKMSLNVILDYTHTNGIGQQIGNNQRSIGSATLLMKHQVWRRFYYELSARQETTDNYKSPFLFAAGIRFDASKYYSVLVNGSRNFRIPTFNDLYWQKVGNLNLEPEKSYQAEIGQQLKFKNLFVSATAYYIEIDDLIQWKPDSNANWTPNNVANVTSYGVEFLLDWKKKMGSHSFNFNAKYGYAVSEDRKTKQQLIYVPFHKFVSGLAYSYKNLSANYRYLFNGYVYTSSDNKYLLKEYNVSNFAIDYDFGTIKTYQFGFEILNIWNENYQGVAQRPMPGRNYSIHLILKF